MGIPCLITIEDGAYKPRRPYVFAVLPRVGELVCLDWDGDRYPEFAVVEVKHIPDNVEELPAYTVLTVRKVD